MITVLCTCNRMGVSCDVVRISIKERYVPYNVDRGVPMSQSWSEYTTLEWRDLPCGNTTLCKNQSKQAWLRGGLDSEVCASQEYDVAGILLMRNRRRIWRHIGKRQGAVCRLIITTTARTGSTSACCVLSIVTERSGRRAIVLASEGCWVRA